MTEEALTVVGTPVRKVDAAAKVTGELRYAGDLMLPRMLHCKLLRSPHPHARINTIVTAQAAEQPGVHAVLTGQDLPKAYGVLEASEDETALAVDKVRFVGDPVAAVAAVDEEQAEAALHHVSVDYTVLQPVMSIEESCCPWEDEALHEQSTQANIQRSVALQFGDVDQGFAAAEHIQEDYFFYEGSTHLAMEERFFSK